MEFAVFAAGIHVARKRVDKVPIDPTAERRLIQIGIAHAADDRPKAQVDELSNNLPRVEFPERKERAHPDLREALFAPAPQILEKDIAESDARHTLVPVREQMRRHRLLVLVVRAGADEHDIQG